MGICLFVIDYKHTCSRKMPPPSVKFVIPARAGMVAVRVKQHPSAVVFIGICFFIYNQEFPTIAEGVVPKGGEHRTDDVVIGRDAAIVIVYRYQAHRIPQLCPLQQSHLLPPPIDLVKFVQPIL